MESASLMFDAVFPADLGAGREIAERLWLRFRDRLRQEKLALPADRQFTADLLRVWVASQFVADFSLRKPVILLDLYHSGDLASAERSAAYSLCLRELSPANEDELMRDLRLFRNREMTRIAWRDITGSATLNQTLSDLSLLAEACLQFAHDFLYRSACIRWETPLLGDGTPQQLIVLGMGKLGGGELNFSSDVDLIFAFEEEGVLKGKQGRSHSEFFIQVARQLIQVIDTVTADGFVFRVDVRLRPFGGSGPLVMTFDAMENYYQSQAREWERYAFIKARSVAGDLEAGARLEEILKPFVYRRYLDYGSFFELRKMRARVEREYIRDRVADNVKLGAGGIREIEFIGQVFQLIRGGREQALQERSILKVLDVIGEKSLLSAAVVATLKNGYEFLRIVENRLQEYADRQVHELPVGQHEQLRIALGLGFADWQSAREQIDGIRRQIHQVFEQVFVSPEAGNADEDQSLIWDGGGSLEELSQAVLRLGYQDSTWVLEEIDAFRSSVSVRKLAATGASVLDRLMPLLLRMIGVTPDPERTLRKLLALVGSICSRQVYLALLVENPLALSQLIRLCAASSWVAGFISQHPVLLDELLEPSTLYVPLSRRELDQQLSETQAQGLERQMASMREFKQACVLRVAAADIVDAITVPRVSDCLTDIAEVVVDHTLALAWRLVAEKYGTPLGTVGERVSDFAVIGYGKLGGQELGYGSDLDLVFLCSDIRPEMVTEGPRPISCFEFYAKVGQRMINLLGTRMLSGILYQVDMRLRPSGRSGLLVSEFSAYQNYQLNKAWTWEHQALVRARFVAGDKAVGERFAEVRARVLGKQRSPLRLQREVREMREKIRQVLAKPRAGAFDLKQGFGGIADIEFIVQFQVLLHAHGNLDLVQFPDVVRLLDIVPKSGSLSQEDAGFLKRAYFEYRDLAHKAALRERPAIIPTDQIEDIRARVEGIWQRLME